VLLGVSLQGKIPRSPVSAWAVRFHFCLPHCIWLSSPVPRGQRGSPSVSRSGGTRLPRGHASWRQSRVGSLAFSLPSPLSQGETASAKWFPCLMRRGPKRLPICVLLFSQMANYVAQFRR